MPLEAIPYSNEAIEQMQEAPEFDEKLVAQFQQSLDLLRFSKAARTQIRDSNQRSNTSVSYNKYSKSSIVSYLENPETNEKSLRQMSRYLYNISCQYRRLIQYFSQMLTFSYIMSGVNIDERTADPEKYYASYLKARRSMEVINVRHEFSKILEIAFKEDIFYGYVNETKDSFQIIQLDPEYCKISAIEDGCYVFQFNCGYFDTYSSQLQYYPSEFEAAYNTYKSDRSQQWTEIFPKKQICIKIDESTTVPIPPFVSLFSALADIEDYRAMSKDASEVGNYKVVYLKMPVDDMGRLKVPKPLCQEAYNALLSILPSGVGAFLTPIDVDFVNFSQNSSLNDTSVVIEAENDFWRTAGVNALMFGAGDDPSSYALEMSVHSDEAVCFRVLRQFERWCNRRLKQISGSYKFAVTFLDTTIFNYKNMNDLYVKMGQYGLPVRQAIAATASFTPSMVTGLAYLENEILKLYEHEVPLISSNTMSSDNTGGRPTNESQGKPLSESGEQTADSGGNLNRVE